MSVPLRRTPSKKPRRKPLSGEAWMIEVLADALERRAREGLTCVECEGSGWACQPPRCNHPLHVKCPWCGGTGVSDPPGTGSKFDQPEEGHDAR